MTDSDQGAENTVAEVLQRAAIHHQNGQYADAENLYRQVLAINPNHPDALHLLGLIEQQSGHFEQAIKLIEKAIALRPSASMHCNLGVIFQQLKKLSEAVNSFQQAIALKPDHVLSHFNLGNAFRDLGNLTEAEKSFRTVTALRPEFADAHFNLGNTLKAQRRINQAVISYQAAITINSNFSNALYNLGICYQEQANLDLAIACFKQVIAIEPDHVDAHSNLIFAMDLHSDISIADLQQERRIWALKHADKRFMPQPYPNDKNATRRIRIAYVSADFRKHSAACVFGPMLDAFDHDHFEVYAYSNSLQEDQYTSQLQHSVAQWKNIFGLSDEAVATIIRQDKIDILVDLSGHSGGNRLLMFARKPAPIQITAWGYIGGTGMQTMDVFFADPIIVPPEEKHLYAEEVVYLPCVAAYFPLDTFPALGELPAKQNKGITFGSFNRLAKVTPASIETWAQILLAIPTARMILKTPELDEPSTKASLLNTFTKYGVATERITLLGKTSWIEHVTAFNQIDIALDPFPHGGGVTALEGIIMGIPIVSLKWPTLLGRLSASILTAMKLNDWVANSIDEYIEIAIKQSAQLDSLAELRKQLRNTLQSTFLGDKKQFTATVEQEYRRLWQKWCSS